MLPATSVGTGPLRHINSGRLKPLLERSGGASLSTLTNPICHLTPQQFSISDIHSWTTAQKRDIMGVVNVHSADKYDLHKSSGGANMVLYTNMHTHLKLGTPIPTL